MKLKTIIPNLPTSDHAIDALAYFAYAQKQQETLEGYIRLFIRKKPWYIPKFLYQFILSKVLFLGEFSKPK